MAVCRYCHSLISDAAGQCFTCGWDWHDPSYPIQRGSVLWDRIGIESDKRYVVELCESSNGDRYIQFRVADEEPSDPYYVTETESVDGARLMAWGPSDYMHQLRLRNGGTFSFDDNGHWITDASYTRLLDRETPTWSGVTANLLSHKAACNAALHHGISIGLADFTVFDAVLLDEKGAPVWHVVLEFEENGVDESIGIDSFKSVRVDAITGVVSSTMSL